MKKVFLLLGIAGFTTASAQQKDVFDINAYLKKKTADKSKLAPPSKQNFKKNNFFEIDANKKLPKNSYLIGNGDRIYSSPGYHMPIVVTDMRQFNRMPNAITGITLEIVSLTKMPNAAPPFSLPRKFK